MKIYSEAGELLTAPDMSNGWLEDSQRVVKHHPEEPPRPAVHHKELMPGTDGLYHVKMDVPAFPGKPAWDEYETVQVYHPYTEEELAKINLPSTEERLTAIENAFMELLLKQGGGVPHV